MTFPDIAIPAMLRRLNPDSLVEQMTDVQSRVYANGKTTSVDLQAFHDRLQAHNRQVFNRTIQTLLGRSGCNGSQPRIGSQIERALNEAAQASAESITNTFNYQLAREILNIGETTPTANYRTYRTRLFGDTNNSIYPGMLNWASRRGWPKMRQIARTETNNILNQATKLFYERNTRLDGRANLIPNVAACQFCEEGISGNPYPSVSEAIRVGQEIGMFHVDCVHFAEAVGRVMAKDCSELWKGEDQ